MTLKTLLLCLCAFYLTACSGGGGEPAKPIVDNNHIPIANIANLSTHLVVGQAIRFDAGASSDSDNDPLSYQWSMTDSNNNALPLNNNTDKELIFVPILADQYRLTLVVNDGNVNSEPSSLTFSIEDAAVIIANAGNNQNVKIGNIVTLSGINSVSQQGAITQYQWQLIDKPSQSLAQLNNANSVTATFTADVAGTYIAKLSIVDEFDNSNSTQINVEASTQDQNSTPVARISADKLSLRVGQQVILDARSSTDADINDTLTYQWDLVAPQNSSIVLTVADEIETTFSPDVSGDYTISLITSDSSSSSEPATLTITARAGNLPPNAVAEAALTATIGQTVLLNGSGSNDPDGDSLSYEWAFIGRPSGSNAILDNSEQVQASFVVDVAGKYLVALKVGDGQVTSDANVVEINVADTLKPNAVISSVSNAQIGETILLNASPSSDPQNLPLTYNWQFILSQGDEQLQSLTDQTTQFIPQAAGTYIIALTVNNGIQNSTQQTVAIEVTEISTSLLSGIVRGVLVNSDDEPLAGLTVNINDEKVSTDEQGIFATHLQVATNSPVIITVEGENLPTTVSYSSMALSNDNFVIDLEQQTLPVMLPLELNVLEGCANYSGPESINIKFTLNPVITENSFNFGFNQTFSFDLNNSYSISLPAEATYLIEPNEDIAINHSFGSGKFEPTQTYTHQYIPFGKIINTLSICD